MSATKRVEPILNLANRLTIEVKRYNLYQKFNALYDFKERAEQEFDLLRNEPYVHYLMGLMALIENDIDETEAQLTKAIELVEANSEWCDKHTKPMCYYYLGILQKNINQIDLATSSFRKALKDWPIEHPDEVRTCIELIESTALLGNGYVTAIDQDIMQKAIDRINNIETSGKQKSNVETKKLRGRLHLIRGNYLFDVGDTKGAISEYKETLNHNPIDDFAQLSIGIAEWKQQQKGNKYLEDVHNRLIVKRTYSNHHELRGRILRLGSALIVAHLQADIDVPKERLNQLESDIKDIKDVNQQSNKQFHIFSPLSKRMVTLDNFMDEVIKPEDRLA